MSVCILPFKVCLGSGLAAYLKAPALELKRAELDCKLRLIYQHLYLSCDNEDSALKRVGRIHNTGSSSKETFPHHHNHNRLGFKKLTKDKLIRDVNNEK